MADFEIKDKNVMRRAVEKYGDIQYNVAIEELSELQKALCKLLRGKADMHNITEEIADVEIMIWQVKYMLGLSDGDIYTAQQYKLLRLERRLHDKQK